MTVRAESISGLTFPDGTVQKTAGFAGFTSSHQWLARTVGSTSAYDRQVNTLYTNNTGKPIAINIANTVTTGGVTTLFVNGVPVLYITTNPILNSNLIPGGCVIVPIGGTFQWTGNTPQYWYELTPV